MAALPRLLPLVVVVMLVPQLLATSCLTNQDCGSGCCSGYGWCVGARSGWRCSGRVASLSVSGSCARDEDCPMVQAGARCCSSWGWCTQHCPQRA